MLLEQFLWDEELTLQLTYPSLLCHFPWSPPLHVQYLMLLEQFLRDEELTLKDLAGRLPPLNELIRDYKVCVWRGGR
jgi:hypothetical protein